MRYRILKFTPEELMRVFGGKSVQFGLPLDVELIDIKYDAFTQQVMVVIRSDTFEDTPEDASIVEFTQKASSLPSSQATVTTTPEITVAPTTMPETTSATLTAQTTSSSSSLSTASQKSLIQTLTASTSLNQPSTTSIGIGVKTLGAKPETNVDTCGFEDEFTKDQRKLLKFTSNEEYVIIKPVQFLKTEWEDINDTVKSIGGKWVKGSTIDYWAIPKNQKQEE